MKRSISSLVVLGCFVVWMVCVPVASAEVPNVFSSGTTAKSSEVNQNFNFVNYGNIVVKSNGVEIGTFLSFDTDLNGNSSTFVLTDQGYIVGIDNAAGTLGNGCLLYSTADCSGTPYVAQRFTCGTPQAVLGGGIFRSGTRLFYIPKGTSAIPFTILGIRNNTSDTCYTYSSSGWVAFPLTPNDPSVTGVSSATFTLPITIERR